MVGRVTPRDGRLLIDLALSHILSRDQISELGYFGSTTRANTRLRFLASQKLVRAIETPFFRQNLYMAGARAKHNVPEHVAALLRGRAPSPRFLRHALCLTNVRIHLAGHGLVSWHFEQQVTTTFEHCGQKRQVKPDGIGRMTDRLILVEADLGHVSLGKLREKLLCLDYFVRSGMANRHWGDLPIEVLLVTTGPRRARSIRRCCPSAPSYDFRCHSHEELGVPWVGSWS